MLSRRGFLIGIGASLVTATPALAQDDAVTQSVLRQLEQQGFQVIQVTRTLLGRVRILARRGPLLREIVLDPRNGQIFRDLVTREGGDGPQQPQLPDYDDEYGDDDDDDEDRSGRGGGDDDDDDDDGGDDDDDND